MMNLFSFYEIDEGKFAIFNGFDNSAFDGIAVFIKSSHTGYTFQIFVAAIASRILTVSVEPARLMPSIAIR